MRKAGILSSHKEALPCPPHGCMPKEWLSGLETDPPEPQEIHLTSGRERGRVHSCKPSLVNALRKGDVFRCWLEKQ